MAKERTATVTKESILSTIADITAKKGTYAEYQTAWRETKKDEAVLKINDVNNIAHFFCNKVSQFANLAKINRQSVKNLTVAMSALSGKTGGKHGELHRCQFYAIGYWSGEKLVKPDMTVKNFRLLCDKLETRKVKTPPPKAQAQAQEAQGTAQEKQEAM